jgi:hypothetical protein
MNPSVLTTLHKSFGNRSCFPTNHPETDLVSPPIIPLHSPHFNSSFALLNQRSIPSFDRRSATALSSRKTCWILQYLKLAFTVSSTLRWYSAKLLALTAYVPSSCLTTSSESLRISSAVMQRLFARSKPHNSPYVPHIPYQKNELRHNMHTTAHQVLCLVVSELFAKEN